MTVTTMSESQVTRLIRSMEDQGVGVTRTKKGLFLRLPDGDSTTIHFTNSDVRAEANIMARLRRAGVRHPDDTKAIDELPKQITDSGMPAPKTKQKILNAIVDLNFPTTVKVSDMIEHTSMEHITISRALFHMGFRPIMGKRNARDWLTPADILDQKPAEVEEESPTFDPPLTDDEAEAYVEAMDTQVDLQFIDTRDSWTVDVKELMGYLWPQVEDRLKMLSVLGMDYEFPRLAEVVKALAGVAALLFVVTLTGCGSLPAAAPTPDPVRQNTNNYDYTEKHILLSDGRTVICLEWAPNSKAGSVSCDWDHAKGTK